MFKTIAIIGILQILTIVVQIVRAKAISVVLGPAGLGVVGLIDQLVTMIATACALSLPTVVLRTLPRVYGEPEFGRQYVSFLQAILIVSSIGAGLLGAVLLAWPTALGELVATYAVEFGVALASVPLIALGLFLPNVLAASMKPVGAAWLSFGVAAMAALAAAVGMLWGGIREIYIAQALGTAALLAATLIYFKVRLHLPIHDSSASLVKEVRARPDIIPTAIAVYASVVGAAFALLVVRYVTARSVGIEAGGLLQAILSMVLAVGAVLIAMGARYLSPLLNRASSVAEKFELADQFRRRQLIILIALTVPLVLFAKLILTIMFSSKFTGAAAWLPAFLVWQLLAVQTNVQLQLLFAFDDIRTVTIMSILGAIASALLCVALIPAFGLSGAAVAMLVGALLTMGIGAERLRRRHGYAIPGSAVRLGGYAVIVLIGAPYVLQALGWDSLPLRILACAILVGGLWLFLEPEEKKAIRAGLIPRLARPRSS